MKKFIVFILAAFLVSCAHGKEDDWGYTQPPKRLKVPKGKAAPEELAKATEDFEGDSYTPPSVLEVMEKERAGEKEPPKVKKEKKPPEESEIEKHEMKQFGEDVAQGGVQKKQEGMSEEKLMSSPLSKEVIDGLIKARWKDVRHCYEVIVSEGVKVEGTVSLGFTIGAEGMVSKVNVISSTLDNEGVIICLVNLVNAWRFPKPVGVLEVEVSYPFVFRLVQ